MTYEPPAIDKLSHDLGEVVRTATKARTQMQEAVYELQAEETGMCAVGHTYLKIRCGRPSHNREEHIGIDDKGKIHYWNGK